MRGRHARSKQSETFRAKIIGTLELQVSLWLADLVGISWGDKSGRHSKNHGSLAGGISRGFAARGGSAAKSHSTSTQYRQLRRLISTKTRFSLKDSKYCKITLNISFVVSVCIILKLNPDEMTLVLGGEMAMWTDDYCFVDQCFLYERGKPDAWWMFRPESDSQFTESVSGIVSISSCKYSKPSLIRPPYPHL